MPGALSSAPRGGTMVLMERLLNGATMTPAGEVPYGEELLPAFSPEVIVAETAIQHRKSQGHRCNPYSTAHTSTHNRHAPRANA
ncbi:MAG: hypothetical protein U0Y68_19515 [Blastocatellia bacterium]